MTKELVDVDSNFQSETGEKGALVRDSPETEDKAFLIQGEPEGEEQQALVISPSLPQSEDELKDQRGGAIHQQHDDSPEVRRCRKMCMEGIQGGGGCTFAMLYILLSFFLMSTMFNMREIVGDYLIGSKEGQRIEYREEIEKAMDLKRRSPWIGHESGRYEEELDAALYYDEGRHAGDRQYLRHHRVPLARTEYSDEDGMD